MVVKEINGKETSGSGGRNTSQFSFRMMEVVRGVEFVGMEQYHLLH